MPIEIKIDKETVKAELIKKSCSHIAIKIDDRIYNLQYSTTGKGIYYIFSKNKFHKFVITENKFNAKQFTVFLENNTHKVAIIDVEEKYLQSRNKENIKSEENVITFPMPGKIVKILVNEGDIVKIGDTLIIISAMKMESEHKAAINGIIKQITIKEGETIEGHQPLIYLEKK